MGAAGGSSAWAAVREIGWLQVSTTDGQAASVQEFVWDRVNRRGRIVQLARSGAVSIAMVPLAKAGGSGYRVLPSGCRAEFVADRSTILAESSASLRRESFLLMLPFSLQSKDVRLRLVAERVEPTIVVRNDEQRKYDVLHAEWGDGESADVVISKETFRPVLVEKKRAADGVLVGTLLEEWVSVGGLQVATRRTDLGSTEDSGSTRLELPPQWASRVTIEPTSIPARGVATLIRQIESHGDVDEALFTPTLEPSL